MNANIISENTHSSVLILEVAVAQEGNESPCLYGPFPFSQLRARIGAVVGDLETLLEQDGLLPDSAPLPDLLLAANLRGVSYHLFPVVPFNTTPAEKIEWVELNERVLDNRDASDKWC